MKTTLHRAGVFALACFLAANVFAVTTYYVDPVNGNDSYSGTQATFTSGSNGPFKTLQRPLDASESPHAGPGDTVYLRAGAYRANTSTDDPNNLGYVAVVTVSGTAQAPITIKAYHEPGQFYPERPVVKGSEKVDSWGTALDYNALIALGFNSTQATVAQGKIYKKEGWKMVGGQLNLDWSQYNNLTWDSRFSNPQQVFVSTSELDSSTEDDPETDYALRRVNRKQFASTYIPLEPLQRFEAADPDHFDVVGSGLITDMAPGTFFYLEDAVDDIGNDVSTIFVWLKDGENPNGKVMEVSTSPFVIGGAGDYIKMEGIAFEHSNHFSYGVFGVFAVSLGTNCVYQKCSFSWFDSYGVYLQDDTLFEDCRVENIGRTGMSSAKRVTIRNCYFYRNNNTIRGVYSPPLNNPNGSNNPDWDSAAGNQASAGSGAMKIIGTLGASVLIEGCEFNQNRGAIWFDSNTGGEEWGSPPIPALTVRNNYIHDESGSRAGGNPAAIFVEVTNTPTLITENVIDRCYQSAFWIDTSSNVTFTHNVVSKTTFEYGVFGAGKYTVLMIWGPRLDGKGLANNEITDNVFYDNDTFWLMYADRNGFSQGAEENEEVADNVVDRNIYYVSPDNIRGLRFICDNTTFFPTQFFGEFPSWTFAQWAQPIDTATPDPFLHGGSGYDLNSKVVLHGAADPEEREKMLEGAALTEILNLQGTMGMALANITGLQGSVGTAQTNIAALQSSVGSAETNIAALQSSVTTAQANIGTLQGSMTTAQANIVTLQGSVGALQTWQSEPTLASGKDFIAGYSTGAPSTADLEGGFRYNTDSSQSSGRNWLLSGDAFNWGEFGLFVSTSATTNPTIPRIFHDAVANTTTIGHNAATEPTGAATLNVAGSLSVDGAIVAPASVSTNPVKPALEIKPSSAITGSPRSAVYLLAGTSSGSTVKELTTDGATPSAATPYATNLIPIEEGKTYAVTVTWVGRATSGGTSAGIVRMGTVKNHSGTTTVLTGTDSPSTQRDNTGWTTALDRTENPSGTDYLKITATGVNGTDIHWAARVELLEISQ
jgi:hypothetical protein